MEFDLVYDGRVNIRSAKNRAIIKKAIGRRDGLFCGICRLAIIKTSEMTIDHIVEKSKDGSDDISNLQLAHAECNRRKSALKSPYLRRITSN